MEQIPSPPSSDNRLIINEGELKLQRLAAIVVAIEILPYNLHCSPAKAKKLSGTFQVQWWLSSHGWKMVEQLSVLKKIQDLVHDPLELVCSEIDLWMKYHIPEVFDDWDQKRGDFVSKFIRHFVWTSFGTIDYVKTAEKWIADVTLNLSIEQKYRLACLNCLENTIENLRNENPELADAETGFPLVNYWNFRIAGGELDDINVIATSIPEYVPVWTHFLEQMDENERYEFCVGRMLEFPARVVKDLLPKFTEIELQDIFEEKLPEFMKLFVVHNYPQFAIQLWRYMGDNLNAKMYRDVFDELRCIEECFGDDGTPDWLGDLGMKMWRCASDNLKEEMFQYKNGDFLCEWTYWFNDEVHCNDLRDDTFLLEMLSDLSPKYRKQFWMAHWSELVDGCEPEYLEKFIKACLPEGDVDGFLAKLANSTFVRKHLKKLCGHLKFVKFIEFLDQFVQDTKLKADLKKRFVPSQERLSERHKFESMTEKDFEALSALLMDVHGSEFSAEYKAKFIRSGFIECISDRQMWSAWSGTAGGEMKPMGLAKHQSFVRDAESFCDEEQLQNIKKMLLAEREFFQALAKEKKNMIVWDDLLKWLMGGKQAMEEDSSLLDRFRNRSNFPIF